MSVVTHKADRAARCATASWRPRRPKIKLDKEPAIKTPDQFKFIGKPMARLDVPLKINGTAKFGIDRDVPDMVLCGDHRLPGVRRHGEERR